MLPKGYAEDTERTYPVVYFHDGQNVLYSKESFSGHSWKVIPTIKRNPDISKMIVVAIDNDGMERMHELSKLGSTVKQASQVFNLVGKGPCTPNLSWMW